MKVEKKGKIKWFERKWNSLLDLKQFLESKGHQVEYYDGITLKINGSEISLYNFRLMIKGLSK